MSLTSTSGADSAAITQRPWAELKDPVFRTLVALMARVWSFGGIEVHTPEGRVIRIDGKAPGPRGVLIVKNPRFARRVFGSGDIGFAEGYMAGEWDSPHLAALLSVLAMNHDGIRRLFHGNLLVQAMNWVGHRLNRNSRSGSRKNIHAHYDLGNAFYGLWLDPTMTYSSARFVGDAETLEAAQKRKYETLCQAMDLQPGQHVLEIGCGWGGFAEHAAKRGARVTGLTISKEQYDFAQARMQRQGLSDQVEIRMLDYRDVEGQFDRVASIEMFEAVGRQYWPAYFAKLAEVLRPGGRAALQIITIRDDLFADYLKRMDFIQKYIFPGGDLPGESVLKARTDEVGLAWTGIERFGQDYARTLAAWAERFQAAWPQITGGKFDERFRRLWLFYLAYCEAGFSTGRTDVIQLALQKG
ncbi:cyclopropane-fatty-acyl-phospholipid synthase family protein [Brevundimonas sp. 2R-24]|uniref:Cyclopropane-fatty-acyl-phospholipid synthase family protein n=1 Tax=Peiella sedimenti TaxID=3061083 RepID=A0ABT8SJC5_9CAUL|nr:cyclopropane-fatty-acyl-phospholipid synthase family protein [Caulobacteraceae bacterium XZ-24]